MRYRLMATYRGAPYEAGIGPVDGEVVLFAACPPPEELGFEPATGHWRKELRTGQVQAVWQSRPLGVFRGDRCIVLDDLGDRLHIGYLGHDAYRAEQLGYWQVDRGVFELVAARDEVTDIVEERIDYPLHPAPVPRAAYSTAPPPAAPGYVSPAPKTLLDLPVPAQSSRLAADGGVTLPPPPLAGPLPLEAAALRAASAASRRDLASSAATPPPAADALTALTAPAAPAASATPTAPGALHAAPVQAPDRPDTDPRPVPADSLTDLQLPASRRAGADRPAAQDKPEPSPATVGAPAVASLAAARGASASFPVTTGLSANYGISAERDFPAGSAIPRTSDFAPVTPARDFPAGTPIPPGAAIPTAQTAAHNTARGGILDASRTISAAAPIAPGRPIAAGSVLAPEPAIPAATARRAAPAPRPPAPRAAPDSSRRQRSAGRRMDTERIFAELAGLAAIPASSYSVGEEVDGAMCLLETPEGFEVFTSAGGARHEVRLFSDEESACFYLFGVLAADAVRTGVLVPGHSRVPVEAESLLHR
jgi:hypothetical protein